MVAKSGSINTLEVVRANNLGLCTKNRNTLGYQMPRLDEVIANLIADEKNYEVDSIAIIPARPGSKRIPRKNIKLFVAFQ